MVANFTLFDDTPLYHTLHRILNVENGAWHLRGMEFHFIEMPKLRKRQQWPVTGLERMLYYLGGMGGAEEMQALAMEDTRVARMAELEGLFRRDPDLLRDYLNREQARRDYNLALKNSEARGKLEGKLEGFAGLVRKGILSLRDASREANMTEDEFKAQMDLLRI
ncbi:MAG: PD-(D/E)XK nuclease family transposase [Fretibacterium sp.]|nr:PD-(D/E)XK nuclease family transposase [Fretibacterium sp.]